MVLAENPIIVVDQETTNLTPRRHLPNLLFDPSQARAGRRVDEYNLARGNQQQDVEQEPEHRPNLAWPEIANDSRQYEISRITGAV
jgi:hypothetical protein